MQACSHTSAFANDVEHFVEGSCLLCDFRKLPRWAQSCHHLSHRLGHTTIYDGVLRVGEFYFDVSELMMGLCPCRITRSKIEPERVYSVNIRLIG